jgi:hypothetical protein
LSSLELRRVSEAALSFNMPGLVEETGTVSGLIAIVDGRVGDGATTDFVFGGSSSVSDSSELDSSSLDDSVSSFFGAVTGAAAGCDCRNRL